MFAANFIHFVPVESSRTKLNDDDATPQPSRKIIKPDLNLLMSNSFDVSPSEVSL